jgi:hypothetical protein
MHFRSTVTLVKPEMRLRKRAAVPETRHHMYVKPVPFRLALFALGIADDDTAAAGELIGMEGKTVRRALAGGIVSETLMANALAVFRINAAKIEKADLNLTIDQFFEDRPSAALQVA